MNHRLLRSSNIASIAKAALHPILLGAFPLLLALIHASPQAFGQATPARPNIIVIMADDMGYSDLGCFGSEIQTPHLDALARDGLRLTQFYNTGRCCPTRAALLTGLYQHQAGIGHMVGDDKLPGYRGKLNEQSVTIAQVLKPAGYTNLMTGKWHVGSAQGHWPLDRGFDRYFGTPSGGGVYFKEALTIRTNVFFVEGDRRIDFPEGGYVTDMFSDRAIEYVKDAAAQSKPFFLYLSHIAPHWPLQAKPLDIEKYKGKYDAGYDAIREARHAKQVEMGLLDKQWKLSGPPSGMKPWAQQSAEKKKDLAHRMEIYAAQIDSIDQNIGKLVAALKEAKVFDNTLILFFSDNGCSAEGGPGGFSRGKPGAASGTGLSYDSAGLEWATVCNTPLRRHKTTVHEGGIASPFIAHWPKGITRKGAIDHQPAHVMDIMATCLELSGADYPKTAGGHAIYPVEGSSLVPLLSGKPVERSQPLCWEHEGNQAIREGAWKLVRAHGQPWELYNLAEDRTELNNLAANEATRVADMKAKYEAWMKRVNALPWGEVQRARRR